jgi:hypothetical protein
MFCALALSTLFFWRGRFYVPRGFSYNLTVFFCFASLDRQRYVYPWRCCRPRGMEPTTHATLASGRQPSAAGPPPGSASLLGALSESTGHRPARPERQFPGGTLSQEARHGGRGGGGSAEAGRATWLGGPHMAGPHPPCAISSSSTRSSMPRSTVGPPPPARRPGSTNAASPPPPPPEASAASVEASPLYKFARRSRTQRSGTCAHPPGAAAHSCAAGRAFRRAPFGASGCWAGAQGY